MTPELLRSATGCSAEAAQRFAGPLSAACAFYSIDTPARLAAFLAQIGHESASLRFTTELWGPTEAQKSYEGRASLGNTVPGDGERFKGHGLIQTTGRFNHARVRDRLRERFPHLDVPDFESEPARLAEPQWACLSAADYWDDRHLNPLADAGQFELITRRINGGLNGQADRLARWERAKKALEAAHPTPATLLAAPAAQPAQEDPMGLLATLGAAAGPVGMLAGSLIEAFTPLAKEKITKEIARHTDSPEVATQVAESVIATAKAMTGKDDPLEAVVAAKADPQVLQQAETDALATLDRLAPLLDKLAGWDKQAWDAEEVSRDAASRRAAAEPNDQDVFLTRAIVLMVVAMMIVLGALIAVLQYLKADAGTIGTLVGLFAGAGGTVIAKFGTRYDHRYGSSRSSGAKDVVISELSRRGK